MEQNIFMFMPPKIDWNILTCVSPMFVSTFPQEKMCALSLNIEDLNVYYVI